MLLASRKDVRKDMALKIRYPEVEHLAAELARQTGEIKTAAVIKSLRGLSRVRMERNKRCLADELEEIAKRYESLPVLDVRSPEEFIEYGEKSLPR